MEHLHFLQDLVVVLAAGIAVVLVSSRFRLPSIVGFLITGTLVGPNGLAWIRDHTSVERMAEIGVIVLLFTIGVELSLGELIKGWRNILVGGGLQTLLTGAAAAAVARALGQPAGASLLIGFVLALSSTAIVMRLLSQDAATTSPHGRVSLGILVFQDLAVVPMMLVVPFLAAGGIAWGPVGLTVAAAIAVVLLLLVVSRRAVPRLLAAVVGTRSSELFLLSILVLCLGTAWATALAGLSLALGAFLAGLVVSESEYSHQALGAMLPFRDAFSCLFFVSIGMLLDLGFLATHAAQVAAITLATLVVKTLIVFVAVRVRGLPGEVAVTAGLLLSQVGEFSFILLHAGRKEGVLDGALAQFLIAGTVLTMAATPLMAALGPRLGRIAARLSPGPSLPPPSPEVQGDHVIIVGYGLNGHNVAATLKAVAMPHTILEINPETVRRLRREGEPILYGTATQPAVLHAAGLERARVMVVTIPDAASARQVVAVARGLSARVHLIVRTRFVSEVEALFALGANEVVPEEFETSIELFSRVLRQYLVPRQQIEALARETRQAGYDRLRSDDETYRPAVGIQRLLGGVEMEAYLVEPDSVVAGRTLAETGIKRESDALVLAVHRGHATTPNPAGDFRLEADDVALLLGTARALGLAGEMFRARSGTSG